MESVPSFFDFGLTSLPAYQLNLVANQLRHLELIEITLCKLQENLYSVN